MSPYVVNILLSFLITSDNFPQKIMFSLTRIRFGYLYLPVWEERMTGMKSIAEAGYQINKKCDRPSCELTKRKEKHDVGKDGQTFVPTLHT